MRGSITPAAVAGHPAETGACPAPSEGEGAGGRQCRDTPSLTLQEEGSWGNAAAIDETEPADTGR